jgi:hypothetical protein
VVGAQQLLSISLPNLPVLDQGAVCGGTGDSGAATTLRAALRAVLGRAAPGPPVHQDGSFYVLASGEVVRPASRPLRVPAEWPTASLDPDLPPLRTGSYEAMSWSGMSFLYVITGAPTT